MSLVIFIIKNIRQIIFFIIFYIVLYFGVYNLSSSIDIFFVDKNLFSLSEKLYLFMYSFFDFSSIFSTQSLILFLLFIISFSLFSVFIYSLFEKARELKSSISKETSFGFLSLLISVLGLTCFSCGVGILGSLFSLIGVSGLTFYLPMHGLEFGYLGVILVNIINYFLWKRIQNPYIC